MTGSTNPYGQNPYGQGTPSGQEPAGAANPYGTAPGAHEQNPYGRPEDGAAPWGAQAPSPSPAAMPGVGHPQGAVPGVGMPAPARPGSITAAFWLIVSAGLVQLLSTALGLLAANTPEGRALLEQTMRDAVGQAGLPAEQASEMEAMMLGAVPAVLTTTAVLGVLGFLLYLLIAVKIRGGSRAARTVGTVLAVLSVLMLLANLAMGAFSVFELLWVGLGVAGIVMAYRKDATEFMRLKAWERAGRR